MLPQKNNQDLSSELDIKNAHDHLFRESMQDIDIARQLASISLPSTIQSCIDWETLEIIKETWINENLKEHRADAIYRVKILQNDQWVFLLFEHKSAPDKKVHVQLLRYILDIWEQHEKQKWPGDFYPIVIPIVICHCNSPCKFDNSIKANIAIIEGIEKVIPDFSFFMLDLWFLEPGQFGDSKLKVLLLALKYSRSPDALSALPQIIRISEKVQKTQNSDYDYLKVVLLYLVSVINKGLTDRFWDIVAREHSGGEAYMKTIADVFREEERLKREKIERDLRKEIEQEKELVHQIVRRMIKKGISMQSIQEITDLSNETIEKIIKNV